MDDLKRLRQEMRKRRTALSAREVTIHSAAMTPRLLRSRLFLNSRRIAAYVGVNGEMDPTAVLVRARQMGKSCLLPVLRPRPQRSLWFCEYRPPESLARNRFGIPEPSLQRHPPVSPWGLDLILLPLVAFDAQGNRLGMGGGYYDRTLAYLRHRKAWTAPRLMGIAYDFQKVGALPAQRWDIPLDGVVTESTVYRWQRARVG